MDSVADKRKKKIVSWIGMLLIVVSIVFIVNRFLEVEIDYSNITTPLVIFGLIAITLANSIIVLITAMNYHAWLYNITGIKAETPATLRIYCSANLYKYIPSGVFAVLGRNRLAIECPELSHGKVVVATILEGTFYVLSALIVAMALSFDRAIAGLKEIEALPVVLLAIAAILAAAAFIAYLKRQKIKKFFEIAGEMHVLKPLVLTKRISFSLALATTWGAVFLVILMLMGQQVTLSTALTVIGLFNLSWLIGFFVPIAPAGLGIRELTTLMLLRGVVDDGYLLLALMAHRVVSISSDVVAYCIAICYSKIKNKK